MSRWMPRIDYSLCTGCASCIWRCPAGALSLIDGRPVLFLPDSCTYCADCESICPVGAISLPYRLRFPGDDARATP